MRPTYKFLGNKNKTHFETKKYSKRDRGGILFTSISYLYVGDETSY